MEKHGGILHCWHSSGLGKMDVGLKQPPCKWANMAQIKQIKCGPLFAKDALLSGMCIQDAGQFRCICLFLVAIRFACGPELGNRSRPPKCHHSMRYVGRMKVPKVTGVGYSNFSTWAVRDAVGTFTHYKIIYMYYQIPVNPWKRDWWIITLWSIKWKSYFPSFIA